MKLNLISELVKDKRVIVWMIPLCAARPANRAVKVLKEVGAREVHVMVSCPPHMNPCFYGIDFPDRSKLMAANHSQEDIRKYLSADSLSYLSKDGMVAATGLPKSGFCMACYDGDYPVPYNPLTDKYIMERRRAKAQGLGEELVKEELQAKLL